jgi:hypothetical protein
MKFQEGFAGRLYNRRRKINEAEGLSLYSRQRHWLQIYETFPREAMENRPL